MFSSRVAIGSALSLAIVLAVGTAWHAERRRADVALFETLKHGCYIVEADVYANERYGFRFDLSDEQLACEYVDDAVADSLEVYVWRKDAFRSAAPRGFGHDIVAKVTINPLEGLPRGRAIGTYNTIVAGLPREERIEVPPSCHGRRCPMARVVMLERDGLRVLLEEFDPSAHLLSTFAFQP